MKLFGSTRHTKHADGSTSTARSKPAKRKRLRVPTWMTEGDLNVVGQFIGLVQDIADAAEDLSHGSIGPCGLKFKSRKDAQKAYQQLKNNGIDVRSEPNNHRGTDIAHPPFRSYIDGYDFSFSVPANEIEKAKRVLGMRFDYLEH